MRTLFIPPANRISRQKVTGKYLATPALRWAVSPTIVMPVAVGIQGR